MRESYIGHALSRFGNGMPKSLKADPEPVRAHVEGLLAAGMTGNMVARAAGLSAATVHSLLRGEQERLLLPAANALMHVTPRPHRQQALVLGFAAKRRIEGLAAMGWPLSEVADRAGLHVEFVRRTRYQVHIQWRTHQLMAEVYEDLSHIRRDNGRTLVWARKNRFVPPMAWDDVDDFYEVPALLGDSGEPDPIVVERLVGGRRVVATSAERRAAWSVLHGQGLSAGEIAERIAVSQRTVERYIAELAVAS